MSQAEFRAKLSLEATISPSEDPWKVATALAGVVGEPPEKVNLSATSARLVSGDPKALVRIRDQLRDRHIRSAARRQMVLNVSRRSTWLMLNRQAAAAGVIAICGTPEESPLGPIYLTVESDRIQAAMDFLAAYPG
jgi:uncharacterized protein